MKRGPIWKLYLMLTLIFSTMLRERFYVRTSLCGSCLLLGKQTSQPSTAGIGLSPPIPEDRTSCSNWSRHWGWRSGLCSLGDWVFLTSYDSISFLIGTACCLVGICFSKIHQPQWPGLTLKNYSSQFLLYSLFGWSIKPVLLWKNVMLYCDIWSNLFQNVIHRRGEIFNIFKPYFFMLNGNQGTYY